MDNRGRVSCQVGCVLETIEETFEFTCQQHHMVLLLVSPLEPGNYIF